MEVLPRAFRIGSILLLSLIFCVTPARSSEAGGLRQTDVFIGGRDGYHTYRIPSLIITKAGTLLAFCEGRKKSQSDSGDVDLLLKRSADVGLTWSGSQVIWDDEENTCGNPCAVIDQKTGDIWLLVTHNLGTDTESAIQAGTARGGRTIWVLRSADDGRTWSRPVEITGSVKNTGWGWYATGPGVGIQIQNGTYAGRLVIPCDHTSGAKLKFRGSHVIFSDDHGASWKTGGIAGPGMNECQVVEQADGQGTLLLDMRSYRGENRRAQSLSRDGGRTWSEPASNAHLIEPVCQASILRYTWPGNMDRSRILFSNPASEKRQNMTVRLSYDEGNTWPKTKVLHSGPSAYSCLGILPNKEIACLYERGEKSAYERITLASLTLEWLTDGQDRLASVNQGSKSKH